MVVPRVEQNWARVIGRVGPRWCEVDYALDTDRRIGGART